MKGSKGFGTDGLMRRQLNQSTMMMPASFADEAVTAKGDLLLLRSTAFDRFLQ